MQCLESLAFVCVCIAWLSAVLYSVIPTRRFSLLYIEVWKRRWRIASTHTQRVVWSLLITNDLLPDMVIVLRRINFKSIPCMEEHFCRQSCYPCLVAKHDQSSGEGGCTLRTIVLFERSWENKHTKLSKFILRLLLYSFTSLATFRQDWKRFQLLKL